MSKGETMIRAGRRAHQHTLSWRKYHMLSKEQKALWENPDAALAVIRAAEALQDADFDSAAIKVAALIKAVKAWRKALKGVGR